MSLAEHMWFVELPEVPVGPFICSKKLQIPHPWGHSRPGWIGPNQLATLPIGGVETRWCLRSLPCHSMILQLVSLHSSQGFSALTTPPSCYHLQVTEMLAIPSPSTTMKVLIHSSANSQGMRLSTDHQPHFHSLAFTFKHIGWFSNHLVFHILPTWLHLCYLSWH